MIDLPFLAPLGFLYGKATTVRSSLYRRGFLESKKLPCTVISIGNLALGGTGKTPTTIWLANYLRDKGYGIAILSRGYMSRNKGPVSVVSDGDNLLLDPTEAGDEPFMMARGLPGVPVLIGKKRLEVGVRAIRDFQPDIIILDDGYQHLQLQRDLNLLLVRASIPFGNGYVFPAGNLREPASAAERADAFILTYADEATEESILKHRYILRQNFPGKPVFLGWSRLAAIEALDGTKQWTSIDLDFQGRKVFAFSGIAQPESFHSTLSSVGINLVGSITFRDHHLYDRKDLEMIRDRAAGAGANFILTTEKDAVKIRNFPQHEMRIGFVMMRFSFEKDFEDFILRHVSSLCN